MRSAKAAAGEIRSFVSGLPIAGMIADPLHTLVREGDCLMLAEVGEFTRYQRVACGLSPNEVTKVVAGQVDEKLCGSGDDSYVYSKPASTICIVN